MEFEVWTLLVWALIGALAGIFLVRGITIRSTTRGFLGAALGVLGGYIFALTGVAGTSSVAVSFAVAALVAYMGLLAIGRIRPGSAS